MSLDNLASCVLCNKPFTEVPDSEEHVLPASIGGRRVVRGFICRSCNNRTGTEWDADVSRQMEHMSLLFTVVRGRGEQRASVLSTPSGEEVIYYPDGTMTPRQPAYKEMPDGTGVKIEIRARSMAEASRMLKGVARKYPSVDVARALEGANKVLVDVTEPLTFSAPRGGISFWRSAVKSQLALMKLAGQDPRACEHALAFLRGQESEPCVGYHYERDLVIDRPVGVPLHVVHVEGRPGSKLVLGYVEYFGFFRGVSCLSSSYEGPAFSATYAIDPRSGRELAIRIDGSLTESEILAAYAWERVSMEKLRDAMAAVVGPAVEAANQAAIARIIDEAMRRAMETCGIKPGDTPTDDVYRRFAALVSSMVAEELARRGLLSG